MSGVEWLDLESAAPPPYPTPPPASAPHRRSGPVRPLRLRLAAVALVLAVAALAGAAFTWQSRTTVRTAPPPPRDVAASLEAAYHGIDAVGCPISTVCTSSPRAASVVRDLVAEEFPDSTVLAQGSETDTATGRLVRTTLSAQASNDVVIEVISQCVPDIRHIAGTPAPPLGIGPVDVSQVVPGPPGCAVTVTAHVPSAVQIPASQVAVIALDPAVQLQR